MPENKKPTAANLEDIISYTPETYFSDVEVTLIRSSFGGSQGAKLLKVIRKALLPTISDPDLPVEELAKDMFMSAVDFRNMPEAEVKATAMGLQMTVKLIAGAVMQLKHIANVKIETEEQAAQRRAKDSTK